MIGCGFYSFVNVHLATMWTQYVSDYLSTDKKAQHHSAPIRLKHGHNVETGFSTQPSSSAQLNRVLRSLRTATSQRGNKVASAHRFICKPGLHN